jgi:hypothetical protein
MRYYFEIHLEAQKDLFFDIFEWKLAVMKTPDFPGGPTPLMLEE